MASQPEKQLLRFHIDLDDDWRATYSFEPQGSEIVIAAVEVRPRASVPRGGLTARILRQKLRPGMAVQDYRARLAEALDPLSSEYRDGLAAVTITGATPAWYDDGLVHARKQLPASPWLPVIDKVSAVDASKRDRLGRLAETARRYVQARNQGHPAPNQRVAELQGRPIPHVRDDLYAARRLGLLSESPGKGRPGGDLTDKARAILAEAAE